MARLRFRISMSLDGYVAGLDQSIDNPRGVGGTRLHEWIFGLRTFRSEHGLEGGDGCVAHQVRATLKRFYFGHPACGNPSVIRRAFPKYTFFSTLSGRSIPYSFHFA